MDRSDVIALVKETNIKNEYGVFVPVRTSRQVFAQVDSVTRSEFHEGGRNGLNPEVRFTILLFDYDEEPVVEWNGNRYAIYRTYRGRDDTLELYAERKGGTNGS